MLRLGLALNAVMVHRVVACLLIATVTQTVSCLRIAVEMSLKAACLKLLGEGHTF